MSLPGLFVVGTDTGVGKTRVAAAIAENLTSQGRRVGVLKPAATGALREGDSWRVDDAEALIGAIGGSVPTGRVAPIVYEEPLAPCVAARRAGALLSQDAVQSAVMECIAWWSERAEILIVEGVGGFLCPLAEGSTVADLATFLDYPLVVVGRRALGTLNHVLLTVEAAQRRGLRLAGLVLNSPEPETGSVAEATNAEELARRLPGIPILAECAHRPDQTLSRALSGVDWYERAGLSRRPSESRH